MVTNRFDQLFDDESDPFEVLKAAENKKKEAGGGGVGGPGAKSAAQAAAQTNSSAAGKQLRKESQKDRKNPLPASVGVVDKKEETQPPVALKKEGRAVVGGGEPGGGREAAGARGRRCLLLPRDGARSREARARPGSRRGPSAGACAGPGAAAFPPGARGGRARGSRCSRGRGARPGLLGCGGRFFGRFVPEGPGVELGSGLPDRCVSGALRTLEGAAALGAACAALSPAARQLSEKLPTRRREPSRRQGGRDGRLQARPERESVPRRLLGRGPARDPRPGVPAGRPGPRGRGARRLSRRSALHVCGKHGRDLIGGRLLLQVAVRCTGWC